MNILTKIIDFILSLFRKKSEKLERLESRKEKLEKELKEIEDENPDTDSNLDYINDK